jgi:hypothetical protein
MTAMKTRQAPWTAADVPGQQGRTAVVTGANTASASRPPRVSSTGRSHDAGAQRRLWAEPERLTGVTFPV